MEKITERKGGKEWKGRTDGTPWMHRTLIGMLRHIDIRVFYAVTAIVIPFYMLLNHNGYLSIYHYFRRIHHYGRLRAFRNVYMNHFLFGQVVIDRFAVYAGKRFSLEKDGEEKFEELSRKEGGFLVLSSHVGNYELGGYTFSSRNKKFYALGYFSENEVIMQNKSEQLAQNNIYLIPVSEDMSHVFAISTALSEGGIVSMPSDRIFGSARSVGCRLLDSPADLPVGPFQIAAMRNVPVLALFVMKTSVSGYRAIIREIPSSTVPGLAKKERTERMAQEYADVLGETLRTYPRQWFNFYEFWKN